MYKIYINETPLILLPADAKDQLGPGGVGRLLAHYPGKAKFLYHYVDLLEKNSSYEWVALFYRDLDRLWSDFRQQFRLIEAAGGVVESPGQKILFIYRRAHWDLPKGKIDPGETPAEAAQREVAEETGLTGMQLGEKIGETYHIYRDEKQRRVLKVTYWFHFSAEEAPLRPQAEEDIERAEWISVPQILQLPEKIYKNILDILTKAGKLI